MSGFYRVDFTAANNEDLRQGFALTDTAGAPLDITGASLEMRVATLAGSSALETSTENGLIVLTDALNGRFDIRVPAVVMRTLAADTYAHDLLLTSVDGGVRRVWTGTLMLQHGVTG